MSVNVYENGELKNIGGGGGTPVSSEIINAVVDVQAGDTIPNWNTPDANRLVIAHIVLPEIGTYMITISFSSHTSRMDDVVLRSPFPIYSYTGTVGVALNGAFFYKNETANNTLQFKMTGGDTNTIVDFACYIQAIQLA